MATYNLNEVLKAKEAQNAGKKDSGEVKLDDVSRVKVLSPGRQVFKRFIRNRLAVFGTCLLLFMFIFSFLGPLVYPYGQKQIFYTYEEQNVNYALAKVNTAYNGYTVDDSVTISRVVANVMNSNVKSMIEKGEKVRLYTDETGSYEIRELGPEVYSLAAQEAEEICTVGISKFEVGTFNSISKELTFIGEEIPGLAAAAAKSCKDKKGDFTYNGIKYTFVQGKMKTYELTAEADGINYAGAAQSAEFETAVTAAYADQVEELVVNNRSYRLVYDQDSATVYRLGATHVGSVYTRYTLDTFVTGQELPGGAETFRANALMAAYDSGRFTSGGESFTIKQENGTLVIYDASGAEYAEFTEVTVRRYSGEDSMDYDLKEAISLHIAEMKANGQKSSTLTYNLPQQDEKGVYKYDDNNNLLYQEADLTITQRDTGEYVINAFQTIYVIDMYASPSGTHILGTDGDGFDVMARIMYGGRISLMVGFVVVFLECFLGIIMGGLAGYYGGWVDMLIMRLVDIFYCLPSMPIMIILGAMMDAMRMDTYIRLMIMMAALGIMGWAGVARMVRGQILSLREQEFMVATEATGIRVKYRIFRHLVPNVMPQLIVIATMGMGGVIITESTLSFLGLGVKHPLATWGTIINSVSSASAMAHYAFIWIPVGLLICLTVIAFNFVGDGLRDAYDPKAKR